MNVNYDQFNKNYGVLNSRSNRHKILKDEVFGFMILASLERSDGNQFLKADIFNKSNFEKAKLFLTDDPMAALARSLNDKGFVDIKFISNAIGQPMLNGKLPINI